VVGGEPRTLLNYAVPIRDEQEQVVGAVAVHVDITARKRAERELQALNEILEERVAQRTSELQASEARFRAIFEEAALGIALTDPQGRITQTNPALQAMLGYLPEELTGLTYDALFERHAAGEDGSQDAPAQEAALYGELLAGARQSYRLERSLRHRDGRPLRVRVMVSLIRDPAGVPRYAVRMLEDVTAQRETQAALLQAEKLAVTGRLAASFAHEIGNPLQSILSVLSVLRDGMAGQSEDLRLLQVAEEEIVRASNIVRQLRDLHRRSEPAERRPTDLRELLESSLLLTRQQAKSHEVAVHLEVAEDLPRVPLAADQMQQVFLNLILNGIEAMPGGGVLRVRAVRTPGHNGAADGVRLDFSDTGAGIAPEDLPRVFESFYSTKPSGLGLGLYVSHGIVQQHGGHITVESAPGQGTTFSVWLPLSAPGGDVEANDG
ncbi:MAG: PAS domain S-box protein, partial [Chloroflexi bacterium]|nr:PAS domain S-box protein [Chloroflexota bacterium]